MALKIIGGLVVAAIIAFGINWIVSNIRVKRQRRK